MSPMRRFAPIALTLALAVLAGTARADTFTVIPTSPLALPSAELPNVPGTVAVPAQLSTPPAAPVQLSYGQLLGLWQSAGAAYGVPWQVLAAINKVESNFGRNMGPSSAGAIGWMQFMPSTWLRWGVDANGDGVADPWNPQDAVYSAARYLAAAGGSSDISRAVFSYNHADWYVNEVLSLSNLYAQGSGLAFSLDRLQQNLVAAQDAVAQASNRLVAARAPVRAAARVEARWQKRADAASLLSDRLEYEKNAGLADQRRVDAQAVVDRAAAALGTAQTELVRARQASAGASFAAGASSVLGAASFQNGWAFPVGGGPAVVSVGHTHHDYPAADIAAPAGSPVYAIAQSVVLRSWTQPDPKCGIGLTLETFDGQTWTYCHLSYLEPTVVAGASLGAGAPVGLVGSTGDSTGPHLHLQLDPATSYPQDEPWFQSFAGVAFSWQDAPTPAAPTQALRFAASVSSSTDTAAVAGAPVFAVVQSTPAGALEVAPAPTGVKASCTSAALALEVRRVLPTSVPMDLNRIPTGVVSRAAALVALGIVFTAGVAWAACSGVPKVGPLPPVKKARCRRSSSFPTSARRRSSSRRERWRTTGSPGASSARCTGTPRTPSSPSRPLRARRCTTPVLPSSVSSSATTPATASGVSPRTRRRTRRPRSLPSRPWPRRRLRPRRPRR